MNTYSLSKTNALEIFEGKMLENVKKRGFSPIDPLITELGI